MTYPRSLILNSPAVGLDGPWLVDKACWLRADWRLFVAALVCLPGCSTKDVRLPSLREQFVLRAEPEQPTSIADAKAKIAENRRVEFVGRIGANEYFSPDKATFLVTEILPDEHGHSGNQHADNCPFCKRKAAEAPRAVVQFVDAAGEILAVDACKLFGIEPADTVVIRGTGELIASLNLLVVTADGIYLKQSRGGL